MKNSWCRKRLRRIGKQVKGLCDLVTVSRSTLPVRPLSNREGGGGRWTVSQETCQLWYGDDEFQITRFDCTELTFRFTECMYLWRKAILYNPAASFMRWIFLSLWPKRTRAGAHGRKGLFYACLQAAAKPSVDPQNLYFSGGIAS